MHKFWRMSSGILMMLGIWSISLNANANASDLTVEVDGLRNNKGKLCLSLFASGRGFPANSNKAIKNQCVQITDTSQFVTFKNLSSQGYAISVLHDENSDNKMNFNFVGIPTEGFGFSGNPRVVSAPPKFRECLFLVAGANTKINIQLNYF